VLHVYRLPYTYILLPYRYSTPGIYMDAWTYVLWFDLSSVPKRSDVYVTHVTCNTVSMYKSVYVLRVYRCIYQGCCSCKVTVYVYGSLYTYSTVSMYKWGYVLRMYRCIYQGCCSCRVTVYMYTVVYIHVLHSVYVQKCLCFKGVYMYISGVL